MRLIFSNAKLFNHPEHAVHIAADFVSLKFERSLALALAELREMSGNGLLRMPIPGAPDQNDAESVLKGIPLSFPCKEGRDSRELAETSLSNHSATTEAGMPPTSHERMEVDTDTVVVSKAEEVQDREKEKENDHVYMTPECKAVSRSGSVIEERDFWATDVLCPNGISLNGQRSRAQSISVTPTTTSATTGGAGVHKLDTDNFMNMIHYNHEYLPRRTTDLPRGMSSSSAASEGAHDLQDRHFQNGKKIFFCMFVLLSVYFVPRSLFFLLL